MTITEAKIGGIPVSAPIWRGATEEDLLHIVVKLSGASYHFADDSGKEWSSGHRLLTEAAIAVNDLQLDYVAITYLYAHAPQLIGLDEFTNCLLKAARTAFAAGSSPATPMIGTHMTADAMDKIWAWPNFGGWITGRWSANTYDSELAIEYTRTDIQAGVITTLTAQAEADQIKIEAQAAEIARLTAALTDIAEGMGEFSHAEIGRYAPAVACAALEPTAPPDAAQAARELAMAAAKTDALTPFLNILVEMREGRIGGVSGAKMLLKMADETARAEAALRVIAGESP